jgi:uncharacterized membrane protein YfcA
MSHIVLLIAAAFAGGAMNAMAGGGSFVTFPALVYAGAPSISANATSTMALFPGYFSSAWAYRQDFQAPAGVSLRALIVVSLIGGAVGGVMLLVTPVHVFDAIVPWLLLLATALFAAGRPAAAWLRRYVTLGPVSLLSVQFLLGIYGGYFGGAVGIMMLAALGLFGMTDLNGMNGVKSLLAGTMNTVALLTFVVAAKIVWAAALPMLCGSTVGSYLGARLARRIPSNLQRIAIIVIGSAMTVAFFQRG